MNKKTTGVVMLVMSAFLYSLLGPFMRIVNKGFGLYSQNFLRAFIITVVYFIICRLKEESFKIVSKDWKWFVSAGLATFATTTFFFVATNNISLGTSIFLFYSFVVVVNTLTGKLLFGETIDKGKFLSLVLAIIGLYLIMGVRFGKKDVLYMLSACLSGVFFAFYTTSSKKLARRYSSSFINMVCYIVVFVITGALVFLTRDEICLSDATSAWLANIVLGFIYVVTLILVVEGFKRVEAQIASLILLLEVVIVVIIGLVFYNEQLTVLTIFGGMFVLLAMTVSLIKNEN